MSTSVFCNVMDELEASLLALVAQDPEEKKSKQQRKSRAKQPPRIIGNAKDEIRRQKNKSWRKRKAAVQVRKEQSAIEALKRLEVTTVPF